MVASANKHRRDVEFEVGDMVFLKFRPYRQSTLFTAPNRKLAPHFFGPFRVEARIGSTAYRLELPAGSRIHPVFHVSLLKRAIGSDVPAQELPSSLWDWDPPVIPETVLERGVVNREGEEFDQVLVKWFGDRTFVPISGKSRVKKMMLLRHPFLGSAESIVKMMMLLRRPFLGSAESSDLLTVRRIVPSGSR